MGRSLADNPHGQLADCLNSNRSKPNQPVLAAGFSAQRDLIHLVQRASEVRGIELPVLLYSVTYMLRPSVETEGRAPRGDEQRDLSRRVRAPVGEP